MVVALAKPAARLDALDVPPLTVPQLPPRVEHLLLDEDEAESDEQVARLADIVARRLAIPTSFAEALMAFGAVHYCPIPPSWERDPGVAAFRAKVVSKRGISNPSQIQIRRATDPLSLVSEWGGYVRVHLHPKRFPEASRLSGDAWRRRVVEETANFVCIDKPWGVSVAPTVDNLRECCLHMVRTHALTDPAEAGEELRLTSRLDAGTSGVLVLAKTKSFCAYFNALLAAHSSSSSQASSGPAPGSPSVTKTYKVLTRRAMAPGVLTHYARVGVRRKGLPVMTEMFTAEEAVLEQEGEGKTGKPLALCQLRVLSCESLGSRAVGVNEFEEQGDYFESTVVLLTGRTHQIRAQFAKEGCPAVGDALYGRREGENERNLNLDKPPPPVCSPNKIGLHAHSLEIRDPQSAYFTQGRLRLEVNTQWWRRQA